ncbi:MAG: hypothetical protein VW833_07030 [Candidatus Neomarinimicrobiota bacterium]|jgi:hypothetical protein
MNVKKIKLRNEVFKFLNTNPSSEVKDIAAHVGVTKQALYYHIKILTKENKIAVTDSTVVNGIEKKFYSIVLNDKGVEKNDPSFDVKRDINEDKTNNVEKNERSNLDESDDGNLIPIAKELSDKKVDENKNLDFIEDQASTKPDISNVSDRVNRKESLPVNSDLVNKRSKTNDIESKKKPKKSFFSNPFNKRSSKDSNDDETEGSRQQLQTIFSNIKSLGLFNLDSYDTMGSATALVTSNNEIITFNNRKDSKFNVNLYQNIEKAAKNSKRNDRLVVIDENFIDNHERIITPLKKDKERQAFISRFVQKKYNINSEDLIFTYEVFPATEKGLYELNTLFSQKKYKKSSKEMVSQFACKDKFFISITGLFSHYNNIIDKSKGKEVNLYLYLGKKGCEITWVRGQRILYNRTILISNNELTLKEYLRESLQRIVNTINVSKNNLVNEKLITGNPDSILLTGPNATNEMVNYFNEKYKVAAQRINVKVSKNINQDLKSNEYGDTALLFKESMRRWGRFKYVYDQKDKLRLKRSGKINLSNFFLVSLSLVLLMINIKFFENNLISQFEEKSAKSNYTLTLKSIKTFDDQIRQKQSLDKFDVYLSNIQSNKKKMFQLFSFLNSELFQSVNYESITLNTTSASTFDDKIFDVRISANIQNLRPEALLEAESIVSGLNSSETIYEGTLETGRYLRDSLPINIAFKL